MSRTELAARRPSTLAIELLSDTTFGRGEGTAGAVDVEVEHDDWGLPFIGGRTTRGLMRDSWLSMSGVFPTLAGAAERVFGRSLSLDESCRLRIGDGVLTEPVRDAVRSAVERGARGERALGPEAILGAFTAVRNQTAEERSSGAPATGSLRASRVVLRGFVFYAPLSWLHGYRPNADDLRVLALAALVTRHGGAARNRGRGHLRLTLDGDEPATGAYAKGECGSGAREHSSEIDAVAISGGEAAAPGSVASEPTYVPYRLTLAAPAILSTLSSDPNSAATQGSVPGSAVRGALAQRLLASGHASDSGLFRELILSGNVRYLHAYPELGQARALPVPEPWRSSKDDPDRLVDLTAYVDAEGEDEWQSALTPIGGAFISERGPWRLSTAQVQSRLHQQRDRVKGRPWRDTSGQKEEAKGAIFAYEALAAEQVFRGALWVAPAARASIPMLRELLASAPLLIGRSRRAGYGGLAELRFDAERERECDAQGALERDVASGERFQIRLLSAYIGRNPELGQIDPTALVAEVEQRLVGTVVEHCFWRFETIGGFNQKWRLELPQTRAVAPGAVLVVRADRPLARDMLRSLQQEGLGERRIDGFGCFVIQEHEPTFGRVRREGALPKPPREIGKSAELDFLESRIVLAAARDELSRVAAACARDMANTPHSRLPQNSLIGRLRSPFRGVRDRASADRALRVSSEWCAEGEANALRESARTQLRGCTLGRKTLVEWLRELAGSPANGSGWDDLVQRFPEHDTLGPVAQRWHLTTTANAQRLLDENRAELTVHLIDALLAALARHNRGATQ